jgi:hypothetical protein
LIYQIALGAWSLEASAPFTVRPLKWEKARKRCVQEETCNKGLSRIGRSHCVSSQSTYVQIRSNLKRSTWVMRSAILVTINRSGVVVKDIMAMRIPNVELFAKAELVKMNSFLLVAGSWFHVACPLTIPVDLI